MDESSECLPVIERSIDLPADAERVWEMIIDGDLAAEWMGVRLEPRVGGSVAVPDRQIIGTVEDVQPGESITWSWREVDGDPSQVTISISPESDHTSVTIVERLLEYQISEFPPIFLGQAA